MENLKEHIREFYKTAKLQLKPFPQWRYYKFQLQNGAWWLLPNQIRNEEHLRKYLLKYLPLNVYSSVCCFLNPVNAEKKGQLKVILPKQSLIFIDIDGFDFESSKIIDNFFKTKPRYKKWLDVNSGNGIHKYYFDTKAVLHGDVKRRFAYLKMQRRKLSKELLKTGARFDLNWSLDDLSRVSRVIGTLNEGIKPCYAFRGLERLRNKSMKGKYPGRVSIKEGRATNPPLPLFFKFISNRVFGVKDLFVPYITLNKKRNYTSILQQVQQKYNLSTFYVFETYNSITALCLKCVSKNRLRKILRFVQSMNTREFEKYGETWIRCSQAIGPGASLLDKGPQLLGVLQCNGAGSFSRPHHSYLQKAFNIKEDLNFIGSEENRKSEFPLAFQKPIKT